MQMIHTATKHAAEKRNVDKTRKMSVAIIGLGYVGLPLSIAIDRHTYEVIGYDIDAHKVERLRNRDAAFLSPDEQKLFRGARMHFGSDPHILQSADVFVVCVPTPVTPEKEPDLEPLISASRTIAQYMQDGALVIIESTVNPGVCDDIVIPTLERESDMKVGQDFYFAYCPERINPGDSQYTVRNIPRVLGAPDQESLTRATDFYRSVIDAEIVPMENIKEAEAVKMVENTFRDINIAFVNELAMSFERVGIDTVNVIKGASTKPFGFMAHYPSCGVGGHCIPVDPHYLIKYGAQNNFTHNLLIAARTVNENMPRHTVDILKRTLKEKQKSLAGTTVAILGLAYKRGISDTRESPANMIRKDLTEAGAHVITYDPHVFDGTSVATLEEALQQAEAVVIATDHEEFCRLQPEDLLEYDVEIVIDGKNCLPKNEFLLSGITYHGIGR